MPSAEKSMTAIYAQKINEKGHVLKLNAWKQTDIQEAYGITIAPSNEIARPVAP